MNFSYKTVGFSAIVMPPFRPDIVKKGHLMFKANRVCGLREFEYSDPVMIDAKCVPQMAVNKEPYSIQITLSPTREVIKARCSCPAGISGMCKHTYAVIEAVNEERTESQTDEKATWGKPSEKNKSLHKKGQSVDDILNVTTPWPDFRPNEEALQQYEEIFQVCMDGCCVQLIH